MTDSTPLGWPAGEGSPMTALADRDAELRVEPVGWMVPRETAKE